MSQDTKTPPEGDISYRYRLKPRARSLGLPTATASAPFPPPLESRFSHPARMLACLGGDRRSKSSVKRCVWTVLGALALNIRTSLDDTVRVDGHCSLVDLAIRWLSRRPIRAFLVSSAARAQRAVELVVLRLASWRTGFRRHTRVVGTIIIVATTIAFGRIRSLPGALLIPYFLWVSFACVLNYSVWQLNTQVLG